jgi:DNA-binding NtrC family response regulator
MDTKYKILVVEDDESIRDLLVEILTEEGYLCRSAYDGQAATEILEEEEFHLLITDYKMPRMTGMDLLKWCRQKALYFPVICISANTEFLKSDQLYKDMKLNYVIKKPLELDKIFFAIEDLRAHSFL